MSCEDGSAPCIERVEKGFGEKGAPRKSGGHMSYFMLGQRSPSVFIRRAVPWMRNCASQSPTLALRRARSASQRHKRFYTHPTFPSFQNPAHDSLPKSGVPPPALVGKSPSLIGGPADHNNAHPRQAISFTDLLLKPMTNHRIACLPTQRQRASHVAIQHDARGLRARRRQGAGGW